MKKASKKRSSRRGKLKKGLSPKVDAKNDVSRGRALKSGKDRATSPGHLPQRARTGWPGPVVMISLVLLAGGVYLNALRHPFVYDDFSTVVNNPSLGDLSNFSFVLLYMRFRPLVNLSYALDHEIWGLDPFGYHLTNVLLHMAYVLLLYLITRQIVHDRDTQASRSTDQKATPDKRPFPALAMFVAGVCAVHPMMTESVAYVSGRAEVLCGVFCLAAFLCLRQVMVNRRGWCLAPGLLCWILALTAKEVGAMLVILLLCYDFLFLDSAERQRTRRLWRLHLPLLTIIAIGASVRAIGYLTQESQLGTGVMWHNALTQLTVFWRYLGLLILPLNQSLVHSVAEVSGVFNLWVLLSAAGLAGLLGLAWRLHRRAPLVTFGLLWFCALLLPSAVLPLTELMAEHRVYIASAGLFLALGAGLGAVRVWLGEEKRGIHYLSIAVAVVLWAALSAATVARNRVWASPLTLWRDAAAKAPDVSASHYQYANELRELGQCDQAIEHYRRAITLRGHHPDIWNNLGICLAELRRWPEARVIWQELSAKYPTYVKAHNNLGNLAVSERRYDAAVRHYRRALQLDPHNHVAQTMLKRLGSP